MTIRRSERSTTSRRLNGSSPGPPLRIRGRPNEICAKAFENDHLARPYSSQVVAVDIDEVVCRYVDGFRSYLRRTGHDLANADAQHETLFREAYDPQSVLRAAFISSGGLDTLDVVPGATAALAKLRALGLRLEAVTTRPAALRTSTERLLKRLLPEDTFAAVHHVDSGEKGAVCNQLGATTLIDDQLSNIYDAAASGVSALLFDYEGEYWWTHTDAALPPGVDRVRSWSAVVDRVLEILSLGPDGCANVNAQVAGAATTA